MLRVIHEQMEKGRNSERKICHINEKSKANPLIYERQCTLQA